MRVINKLVIAEDRLEGYIYLRICCNCLIEHDALSLLHNRTKHHSQISQAESCPPTPGINSNTASRPQNGAIPARFWEYDAIKHGKVLLYWENHLIFWVGEKYGFILSWTHIGSYWA